MAAFVQCRVALHVEGMHCCSSGIFTTTETRNDSLEPRTTVAAPTGGRSGRWGAQGAM